ncbi:MAG TPA: polysaccharide deacetylase family protein [Pyrinomonadaceae bacterium]|jgi:peptidoglycan/xylan/chitin deacetylase (PgdA/CDA1 family)|nr:polysaccharide deacetylase family protein [Pyrinomonadaceae bacterium]
MKKLLFALLYSTGVLRLVSWWHRKRVPIVCYHSVTSEPVNRDPHKQHLPQELFVRHLDYLQKRYNVVSLADYLAARRNSHSLPDYSVVLTFDDGFEDFYSVAAQHLRERNLPATVFVITDHADARYVPNGESFLNWNQIRELFATGIEIGSHTCSHVRLSDLSREQAANELTKSRTIIESNLGQIPLSVSFPFGQTSESISRLAESSGYSGAIANDNGLNSQSTPVYALSRTVIASDDDVVLFAARVSGLTTWVGKWRRFLRPSEEVTWKPSLSDRYEPRPQEFYID